MTNMMWRAKIVLPLLVLLFQLIFLSSKVVGVEPDVALETYNFHEFPKNKIALHFSCKESNMFATNCACHLRCTDSQCENAKKICKKYEDKGCRYVLLRGGKNNRIATLKRIPTQQELQQFDLSAYPKSFAEMEGSKWATMMRDSQSNASRINSGGSFRSLVEQLGPKGGNLMREVFEVGANSSAKHCGSRYATTPAVGSGSVPLSKKDREDARQAFLSRGIALVALSYHTPMTLLNSMRSWKQSGLLDMVTERVAILNDPLPQEVAIALEHGFRIIQPRDVPGSKMAKSNVWTIGAAFYYALTQIQSEYLLFLENDFKMDVLSSPQNTMMELVGGAALLDSGVEIIRLNSRRYQGCNTFKSCDHHGIDLQSQAPGDRLRNWFAFYCRDRQVAAQKPYVSDCSSEPDYRCFTSWDTNWTLNAVLVKKGTMLHKKYPMKDNKSFKSIADIGLDQYRKQDGFETAMIFSIPWQRWQVPICISYNGLFIHEEIETSA